MKETKAPSVDAVEPRRMLRLPSVKERTGLARSSIYRAMDEDGFPRQVHVGQRAVAWVESEVEAWLDRKLAERRA